MNLLSRICAALALVASCAHTEPYTWVDELPPPTLVAPAYRIQPGDQLTVSVWNQEHLSGPTRVRLDGRVTVPLLGDVEVAGATLPVATERITRLLHGIVLDPKVTLSLLETHPPAVTVVGEVKAPGSIALVAGDGLLNVLAKAGGLTEFAHSDEVYVLRRGPDVLRVRFDYERMTGGLSRGIEFSMQDGDIVVVR